MFWLEEHDDGWLFLIRGWWSGRFDGSIIVPSSYLEEITFSKSLLLSLSYFQRVDRMTFFAMAIHLSNEFAFNSTNSVIYFANHLHGLCWISLA